MSKVRPMLLQANLPDVFWGEAVLHAAYLKNRTPTKVLDGLTPHEALTGSAPDNSHLRIFGSQVHVIVPTVKGKQQNKLDDRAEAHILLGNIDAPMHRVFNTQRRASVLARHVKINENVFPGFEIDSDHETDSEASDYDFDIASDSSSASGSAYTGSESSDVFNEDEPSETEYIPRVTYKATSQSDPVTPDSLLTSTEPVHNYNTRSRATPDSGSGSVLKAYVKPDSDNPTLKMAMASSEADKWTLAIQKELH